MMLALQYFDPQPAASEIPRRFPSPFAATAPHAVAVRAARELEDFLRGNAMARECFGPAGGKMFGVLVVQNAEGRAGYLRAFSGMLGGSWLVGGFVPPLFDLPTRQAFWPAGEIELEVLAARIRELEGDPLQRSRRDALETLQRRHASALVDLQTRHRELRARRQRARQLLQAGGAASAEELHRLAQQSRADKAEKRRLAAQQAAELAPLVAAIAVRDEEARALRERRALRSQALQRQLHDTYNTVSVQGEQRGLRELFNPDEPPAGTGDCAGPKLIGHALRQGLRPLALAELWWGAAPSSGGRHSGVFYPSCRGKCGPLLSFMLEGLELEPAPAPGAAPIDERHPEIVYEDEWLAIVDKPCGLLSVPGKGAGLQDSALTRLRARFLAASGPLLVHRLDLDTSGLLLMAKSSQVHAELQELFARRKIEKRYVAVLDGATRADGGTIELPLRVDLDDRPRQIVDPTHGRAAITEWRVLERAGESTRVLLLPRTGRTHQLRLHSSHPLGIGVPIVGDRLYGRAAERLMLHAEELVFEHPRTGQTLRIRRPAPF